MGGGIVQIATYGAQDIYLVGNPEITFFKIVYRRHTNFSIESIKLSFDDEIGFDTTSNIKIQKTGDLINKSYLEFEIPAVHLSRHIVPDSSAELLLYNDAETNYNDINDFIYYNMALYRQAINTHSAENSTVADIQSAITNTYNSNTSRFNQDNSDSEISKFTSLLSNLPITYPNSIDLIFIKDISDNYEGEDKNELKNQITRAQDIMIQIQSYFFDLMKSTHNDYLDKSSPYAKFAWVRRLGHSLIEKCEIDIGGYTIDTHYGEWINIWNELTLSHLHEENYLKMIGDIPKLYNYDREGKPFYSVKVPLLFWFSRFTGLSLPLISLENCDVIFKLKTRSLDSVAYIEPLTEIKVDGIAQGLTLRDLELDEIITLNASLYIDYIFLGSDERRRFAQVSNEYLIETLQMNEYEDITKQNFEAKLDFVHPCKALFWTVQKQSYRENNEEGSHQCRWNNFTSNTDKKSNPILNTEIYFHGQKRNDLFTDEDNPDNGAYHTKKFYNYLQPNRHFLRTPDDGINTYSFALYPTEHQPSGQCNMSRLKSVVMKFLFDKKLFEDGDKITLKIYTTNITILRLIGGYGALAFSNR